MMSMSQKHDLSTSIFDFVQLLATGKKFQSNINKYGEQSHHQMAVFPDPSSKCTKQTHHLGNVL